MSSLPGLLSYSRKGQKGEDWMHMERSKWGGVATGVAGLGSEARGTLREPASRGGEKSPKPAKASVS